MFLVNKLILKVPYTKIAYEMKNLKSYNRIVYDILKAFTDYKQINKFHIFLNYLLK